jgi:MerR family transcriptional regulator, heat shock protein HspR
VRINISCYLHHLVDCWTACNGCYRFYITHVGCSCKYDDDRIGRCTVPAARDSRRRGVYAISVAAELTGAGLQNLRVYERRGLVEPSRTAGGTRRYSEADLDRVRRVLALLEAGLNLAGIALVLELEDDNARLRHLVGDDH